MEDGGRHGGRYGDVMEDISEDGGRRTLILYQYINYIC